LSIKVNWKRSLIITASLTFIFSSGCSLLPKEDEALAPPLVKPVKQNFTTIEVKKTSIEESIKGVSTLMPYQMVYHQFKDNGGRVQEIFVRAGNEVKIGDPLIQLEVEGLDLDIKYKTLDLEKAKVNLEAARQSRDESNMKLRMLELDIAQTNYNNTLAKLHSRRLTAEMEGVVTFVTEVRPPDFVKTYDNLVVVADMRKLRLVMEKTDVSLLTSAVVGMKAEVTWKGNKLMATVTQTPSSAPQTDDPQLRDRYNKSIYMELDEIPEDAKMGDTMDVKIITKKKEETLVIPSQALRTFMSRNYVQILDGERISEADVEIGIKNPTEVEILAGIQEGQQLILR